MKYHILFSLLATTFVITGCTTTKSIKYPVHGQNTTISVSSEQISAMTESGAGDYFISDSQITVGDASKATSNPAASAFGLIGMGIATAIEKNTNASAISKSSLKQAIKFDDLTNAKINQAQAEHIFDPSLKILAINQASEIKVVPYARISFKETPLVSVNFGLKTEFKNSASNQSSAKRFYSYMSKTSVPLSEWDSSNNALFNQKADQAFNALAKAFILDAQHQLNLSVFSETKQKTCQNNKDGQNLSFLEAPEDICIGVLKDKKGKTFEGLLFVVEQ
ncbi:hypothetical protein VSN93_11725 [Acinetobacter johnsonii]|uniref:hypothetical protein n=1 Tax=Acinetobacter johnsonii TaxID=40214 RepID=UPI003D16CF3E